MSTKEDECEGRPMSVHIFNQGYHCQTWLCVFLILNLVGWNKVYLQRRKGEEKGPDRYAVVVYMHADWKRAEVLGEL